MVAGQTNEEISEVLAINIETVKQHVKSLLKKIGVVDRTQARASGVFTGATIPCRPMLRESTANVSGCRYGRRLGRVSGGVGHDVRSPLQLDSPDQDVFGTRGPFLPAAIDSTA